MNAAGREPPRRVCVVGAECCGKTTLTQQLAAHFAAPWVPEYLREFCAAQGRTPHASEQAQILQAQCEREELAWQQAHQRGDAYVFCDTAPLLTAVYSDFYFSDRSLYAAARAWHARYGLTLFLRPDIAWQPDAFQRDGVPARSGVDALLQAALSGMQHPVCRVGGQGAARLQAAIKAVDAKP